jgi:hypothetical protein
MSITDIISVIMSITDIISVIMSITDIISVIMSITDIISVVTSVALPLRDVAVRRVACVLLHSAERRRIHAIFTSMIAQTEQHAWSSRGASIAAQVHLLQRIDPASIAAQVLAGGGTMMTQRPQTSGAAAATDSQWLALRVCHQLR